MRRLFSVYIALLFTGFVTTGYAQGFSNFSWYFGDDDKGIIFQKSDASPLDISGIPSLGLASSAVAADPYDGEVLFYTDGIRIFNYEDNNMLGGDLLPGTSANPSLNQTVAICINPQNNNQYYVFTRKNNGEIAFAVIDINGDNVFLGRPALGAVASTDTTIPLLNNTSPAILIIPNLAKNGFILIAHQTTTGNYLILPINTTGLGTVMSVAVPGTLISTVGSMSYDAINNRIAVTSTVNGESAEIIDLFGMPTGTTIVPNTSFAGEINYDTEWSASGDYLYLSRNGGAGTGNILQYDVVNDVTTTVLTTPVNESFGIQMAPDSAIYHLYEAGGQTRVGRIANPEVDVLQLTYVPDAFSGQTFNAEQFPAFLPEYRVDVSIAITPAETCLNVPTVFNIELTNTSTGANLTIDEASWDFDGDGMPDSNQLVPVFTFTDNMDLSPTISVSVTSGGESYIGNQTINITDFDVMISGVMDSIVCPEQLPLSITATAQSASGATPVFQWSNATTPGPTASLPSAGEYYVTATVGECAAYETMTLTVYDQDAGTVTPVDPIPEYWYFGDRAGLEFLGGAVSAVPLTPINQISTSEGCSIYTNAQGEVLLYTDGETVYDRNGDIIGTDIGGNQDATQSALIVPTSDETIFYIFTTQEVFDTDGNSIYECRYSVFDLKLRNGVGGMLVTDKHLFNASTERIASDGNWVIGHEYGTNTFKAFQLQGSEVSAPVISDVSTPHDRTLDITGHGQMKLSSVDPVTGNARLAVALSLSNSENYVEFFDFDAQTGEVSNPTQLDFESNTGQVYGVEFSPSGNILYATLRSGTDSQIFRWEIDTTTVVGYTTDLSHITTSFEAVVPAQGAEFGALQIGPNGQIYVAVNNSTTIGSFASPDATFTQGTFQNPIFGWQDPGFTVATDLAGQQSKLGLPSSGVDSQGSGVGATINPPNSVCLGEVTTFSGSGIWQSDQLLWFVATPSNPRFTQQGTGSIYNYPTTEPGIHTVRLVMRHQAPCPGDEVVGKISFEVYPLPQISLPDRQDATDCLTPNGSFTVRIESTGSYTISVTGQPDRTGQPAGDHAYLALASGTYAVTVTNEDPTGCSDTFTVPIGTQTSAYNILPDPTKAECDGTDGSINFTIVNTTGAILPPYDAELTNESTGSITSTLTALNMLSGTFTPIDTGTYTITIRDSNNCIEVQDNITISTDPQVIFDIETSHAACDDSIDIPFTTDGNLEDISLVSGGGTVSIDPANGMLTASRAEGVNSLVFDITSTGSTDTCPTRARVSISFFDQTPSPLEDSYKICPKLTAGDFKEQVLDPGPQFTRVTWYYEDGTTPIPATDANYEINGNVLTAKAAGNIVGVYENALTCQTIQPINIIEECIALIVPPNAFRPDSGVTDNQSFSIYSRFLDPDKFEVYIYNRWGELIFHSPKVDFQWNGGFNNDLSKPAPLGTYAYVLKYVDTNDELQTQQEQRGGVLLIR